MNHPLLTITAAALLVACLLVGRRRAAREQAAVAHLYRRTLGSQVRTLCGAPVNHPARPHAPLCPACWDRADQNTRNRNGWR